MTCKCPAAAISLRFKGEKITCSWWHNEGMDTNGVVFAGSGCGINGYEWKVEDSWKIK